MLLTARFYVDPTCCHTWHAKEPVARLRREYGGFLDFAYVLYPLRYHPVEGPIAYATGLYKERDMAAHAAEVSEYLGRPIAHSIWQEDPIRNTRLSALAVHAARRQSPKLAEALFERLQLGAMALKENIGRPEVVVKLAVAVGLNPAQFVDDLQDPQRQQEVEADLADIRMRGVHSRPTLILSRPDTGAEVWVVGPQPDSVYTLALLTLLGGKVEGRVVLGGRVRPFGDILIEQTEELPDGWRHAVACGYPPRPGTLSAQVITTQFVAAALPQNPGFLQEMWAARAPIVAASGLDPEGRPVRLLGTRAEHLPLLRAALDRAGVTVEPPLAVCLAWMIEAVRAMEALPVLKWVPGGNGGRAALAEVLGPAHLILTLAVPLPIRAALTHRERIMEDLREYTAMTPAMRDELEPAFSDSAAHRSNQAERLARAGEGYWNVHAAVLAPGPDDRPRTAFRAVDGAFYDPGQVVPLRTVLVKGEECEHLKQHLLAFTLCGEQELHCTDWWNTALLTGELLRYHF